MTKWKDKKPICVFRGGATGCGITRDTNMRIKACELSYEKSMDFEVQNQKIREKISSTINVVFDCIFLWILGGFGEDFGRVLGGVWRLLALLGSLFGILFWCFYLQCSPKGLLEAPGIDFGSILKGLARVLGWVL